jgi:sugar lactone lactonase YvrE
MTKSASRILKVLVISLATVAISRGGVALATTLPVATLQSSIEKGLRTPTRLAVGTDGSLYVADPANQGVLKFSASGALLQKVAVKGIPQGIAVTSSGRLLVSQKEFVALYDTNGTELRRLGLGDGQFVSAADIAIDDTGLIYVTDSKGKCVQVFDADGGYLSRFGAKGSAAGQFLYPTAIAYEKVSKQIAVVDSLNARVQFFDKAGVFIRSIGTNGTGPLKFMHPQGLAFENGTDNSVRMYVSDAMLRNIQAIDPAGSGSFISYVKAGKGTEHGSPSDLAFDQTAKRLYVVDGLGSITVYQISDGTVVVNSVTPAAPASATVIATSAQSGTAAVVASTPASTGSPLSLSMVSDGSAVTQELLDVTGLVTGVSSVTVNGEPVAVANGLFSTAVSLQSGANEISITVTDNSGKTWKEIRNVTKVTEAPSLSVAVSDVQATNNATLTLKGHVDKGVYVAVAGIPADIVSQEWHAAVTLAQGLNTIEVQAIDLNGQAASQKRTIFFNPSSAALTITEPAEDAVTSQKRLILKGKVSASSEVTVTAEVNGIPKKIEVDDGEFSLPVEFQQEGVYTVTVFAVTAGGDVSTVSRSLVFRKK